VKKAAFISRQEDAAHILLKCNDKRIWREGITCKKWLEIKKKLKIQESTKSH
jgi:hypothetical protein